MLNFKIKNIVKRVLKLKLNEKIKMIAKKLYIYIHIYILEIFKNGKMIIIITIIIIIINCHNGSRKPSKIL